MPHHKQTKKRLRKSVDARGTNRQARSELRTTMRRLRKAVDDKQPLEQIQVSLKRALSISDRLCKRGIIKRNTASRYKSRLMLLVNKAAAPADDTQA